jgi:hypothetical protein
VEASFCEQLEEVTLEPLRVVDDGVRKKLTQREISAIRIANKMAVGDLAAWKKFIRAIKTGQKNGTSHPGYEIVVVPNGNESKS